MSAVGPNAAISGAKDSGGPRVHTGPANSDKSFANALREEVSKQDGVRLSAHAQKRLIERNVEFGDREHKRLSEAVSRINQKGADKSLVLMDDLALLVSARNRTVITALDSTSARNAVFTNIDSAVII